MDVALHLPDHLTELVYKLWTALFHFLLVLPQLLKFFSNLVNSIQLSILVNLLEPLL
jgi:hypothetical protein